MNSPRNTIVCGDALTILKGWPDGCVDVIVADPPYGIGEARGKNKSRSRLAKAKDFGVHSWDDARPTRPIFDEMRRVSRNQVIFGGNYFADLLPPSMGWIVWDKDNGANDFADCELAWTSYRRALRKIRWRWQGMLQEPGHQKDRRVHPTQKPLGLMLWVIEHYTQPGDLICDPFCGSGTTLEAAERLGRAWIGIDISPDYVRMAERRVAAAFGPMFAIDTPPKV